MKDTRHTPVARLLIVEDEPLVAEDLRLRLQEQHYQVTGLARGGQQAIDMADEHNPDLVLMDIVLEGGMDGIQAAEVIRHRFGIPVIFVTAYTDQEFLERAKHVEPFGYIVKPVRSRELSAVVSMALYRNQLERQLASLRWGAGVCDHLFDAIIAVDPEGVIAYVNDAAKKLIIGEHGFAVGNQWRDECLTAVSNKPLDISGRIRTVMKSGCLNLLDEDLQLTGSDQRKIVRMQLVPISTQHKAVLGVAIVLRDVTEQRNSTSALLRTENALRDLHEITSDQSLDSEQKIHRLLKLGTEKFELPIAILSRVDGDNYQIVDAVSPDGLPKRGSIFSLGETYCRNTLEANGPLGFTDAQHSEWRAHPAYLKCHMEVYLGIPVRVAGEVFGTLNFSSAAMRPKPFTNDDFEILKLMAQWLGSELERHQAYRELEEEKRRTATLAQISPQGIFRTDAEGRCNYVNTRWCEITGLSLNQVLGKSWAGFTDAAEQDAIGRQWQNALQYKMDFTRQCRFNRGSGSSWVLVRIVPEYDGAGNNIGYVGSLSDISDLKETQDALLLREQAYSDLLGNLAGMAYRCNNDADWTMAYVSEGCKQLTGWSVEDLTGNRHVAYNDLIHPDDTEHLWNCCQKSLEARKPCSNEYRIITRSGEVRWVWDQSRGRYDDAGKLIDIEGFISDITPMKVTEDQLARSKAEFEAMLNAIPDAIVYADAERRIQVVNPAVQQLFGYSPDDLIGATTEILYCDSAAYLAQGKQRFNFDAVVDATPYEIDYRRQDGSSFVGETIGIAVRDASGRAIGLLGVIRDITERRRTEEKMQQALRQLQALYNASPDMIFLHDSTGKLIDANDNVLEAYGYTREELLSLDVGALSGGAYTTDMAAAAMKRVMAGESVDMQWVGKRSDGTEFPVEVRLRHLEEPEQGAQVVAIVRDLSERFRSEEIIKQERDFSAAILDTIGSVVVVLNAIGEIVRFNKAAQDLTGYSEQEVLGKCVWDFLLLPEETAGVAKVFRRLTAGDFPNSYENSWLTKSGEQRVLAWNNSALLDATGQVEYVIATGIDITRQRRVEGDLLKIEAQWNEVIDFLADPVYLVGLDDKVIRANRAFYQLTDKAPGEVLGHDIAGIMHPQGERTPCPVCIARKARKDTTVVLESGDTSNLLQRPIEVTLRVIRDQQGDPEGILMGIRDLTQQRRIEAELREHRDNLESLVQQRTAALENANRELEAFSYSVSHDLRAPLRGIDGFSQALLDDYSDKIDSVGQDYLHRVRRASQRLGILIDDLLQLSRVGRSEIEYKWVDLSRIASAVLKELQEGEPEQRLNASIQDGVRVCGDAVLLRLMMQNLLGNAWKFTSVRATSEISFGVQEDEAGRRVFFVADNGVGFDMTYASKLFGAFQRLHTGQEFEGTGVGLATVQRIIHRHEGEIWGDSKINEGAKFYFTLPDEHCS